MDVISRNGAHENPVYYAKGKRIPLPFILSIDYNLRWIIAFRICQKTHRVERYILYVRP